MNGNIKVAVAGFLATAVAFGPARMGYGLFLPRFREEFGFSIETAGFIASAAYGSFLLALLLTGFLSPRLGPRAPVIAGGLAAASGMGLVAGASSVHSLAAGVILAASSAGFCWVPYNNAVGRAVSENLWGRVLSIVSTGTTFGIAGAAVLALAILNTGFGWRITWAVFSVAGLAAAVVNAFALGDMRGGGPRDEGAFGIAEDMGLRELLRARAVPLYGVALSFGVTSSIFLSFAVEHVTDAGGLGGGNGEIGPILFLAFGAVGVPGMFTGEFESRIGLRRLLRIIFICSFASLALLGVAPGSWATVLVSAALQGGFVMTVSAVLAFWSLRVFPFIPAVSFTAVLLLVAAGNAAGPALASLAATRIGMGMMFLACGGLSLLTALALPRGVREYSGNQSGS
ncbi:MFS transporter [Desulfohalovibrio reitneri]|uniref:MFS transporter n=1 Tax=Desulfohalovibrio reitneri TaxID=1307759 RepID=UPI00068AC859|nr:MFS transporter [Desulfohalovibrio reitneri]